jgi:transposase InsO family protein
MQIVEQVRMCAGVPYRQICRELGVPRSSLMRWRTRRREGQALADRPGPAKVEPLRVGELLADILLLAHGKKRTHGTLALYAQYRDRISRRDLQALVAAVRREIHREEAALTRHIDWLVPGSVWSMDDAEKRWLRESLGHLNLVLDLGSRYNLKALGDEVLAHGPVIAANLDALFRKYGPPLLMKMDGGSNFKHREVHGTFEEFGVIPLLSPPHYPPYNGSVEREHQEIFRALDACIGKDPVTVRELKLACALSGHEVNHMRRRVLGGRTACEVLQRGHPLGRRYDRRERKEVFDQIKALAVDIVAMMDEHTTAVAETAFRYAAETWMQENNVIRVTQNGRVLPSFYRFWSH